MKKVLFFTIMFVFAFQAVAMAADKIGVFSMQSVLIECEYGKAIGEELKKQFEPKIKELQKEEATLKTLEAELKNQDFALSPEAKDEKKRAFFKKARDYQENGEAFDVKRRMEAQKLQQPLLEKILKTVNEYGKANNYAVIIEMRGSVLYFDDSIDVTNVIIQELNKMKKAGK